MRSADKIECLAGGAAPDVALDLSIQRSTEVVTELYEGEVIAMWGWRVDSFLGRRASVWLLTFEPADKCKVYFARGSLKRLYYLLHEFRVVECEVHARHEVALRWLRWLGFDCVREHQRGPELFYIMTKERS